jgi:Arc/MetJ-type ribon-helix-helix transcriptional regulator
MSSARYYSIGIPMDVLDIIKKIIIETKLYRNPSDFVLFAVREKIDEIHKNQIDQKKIEAFFIRENQNQKV